MFGGQKRKPPEKSKPVSKDGEPIITALLMEGDRFPFDVFFRRVQTEKIAGANATDLKLEKEGPFTFSLRDEMVAVMHIDAPYPWSDLEGPCATSWMWPKDKPASEVKHHRSHVLVTMMLGKNSPVVRRLTMTDLTAEAAKQPGVLAIYWPEATLIHYPPVFIKMVDSVTADNIHPCLYLWVDFRVNRNADGTFMLFTTGMEKLGLMEIEIPKIQMPPRELRPWAMNLALYLMDKGPVLNDGHTVGVDAQQKIRVHHASSMFNRPGKVLRLEP